MRGVTWLNNKNVEQSFLKVVGGITGEMEISEKWVQSRSVYINLILPQINLKWKFWPGVRDTIISVLLFCKGVEDLLACLPAKSLQSCPTFCDPMDCSLTGFFAHGIPQAGILEWVAMPFSKKGFLCNCKTEKNLYLPYLYTNLF